MDEVRAAEALADLARRWPSGQFALLSTCNRTEIYAARPVHAHPREHELTHWLAQMSHQPVELVEGALYQLADASAVHHLLAVAAGLDSLVLGEPQIAGQVRRAYDLAVEAQTAGDVLHELFQGALRAGKEVRTQTDVSAGNASVASAALDCVTQTMGDLTGRTVLCVGAGKITRLLLGQLRQLGARELLIANRSPQRAAELAADCDGQAIGLDDLPDRLADADVVLTSTASPQPLLSRAMVAQAQQTRGGRAMLIVDLAVPRDVEPTAGRVDGVTLLNIDDLQRIVASCLARRSRQLVPAEAIIARHVARLVKSLNIRGVAPTITALYRHVQDIADDELAAALNRLAEHEDAAEDEKILRHVLHRVVRRIVHPAAESLRRSAGSDTARSDVAALRRIFELDE
jgi:glutamyl-tRNA reductase